MTSTEILRKIDAFGTPHPTEVRRYVSDAHWQMFRTSLKGDTTERKLQRLWEYYTSHVGRAAEVRVRNYIGALKRGGQVSPDNQIIR